MEYLRDRDSLIEKYKYLLSILKVNRCLPYLNQDILKGQILMCEQFIKDLEEQI